MTTTFMRSPRLLFTSESVTEGHPDKVCDQISDAVLDWCISQNPRARVACEASAKSNREGDWVAVYGEVSPLPPVDVVQELVRGVLRRIGYTDSELGASPDCEIDVKLGRQSEDIAMGVDHALEEKLGEMSDAEVEGIGAGDQGMMIGFACNETESLMPLTIALAQDLCRALAEARRSGQLSYLRPDGKSQVTVEYAHGKPVRVDTVVISTQHDPDVTQEQIRRDVENAIIREVVPANLLDAQTRIFVNPTGNFVIGGPRGDSGLTGRKIIVDTYGGVARHGGGAFSGKDPTKVDRSAAYAARYVAKNVVAAGLADRFEVQLAYAIGVAKPISISCETFGTAKVDEELIVKLIDEHFDLRPGAIIRDLRLRRPIYEKTAAYGHFGRTDIDAPWEVTDKAAALRAAAGLVPQRELVGAGA
ncbi:MAG: S-adenosylmethionine synthetase [uncultured Chloroflexi bacterium]|uniref:S-adenosylmethionine synthase n=1 Tax=uncultured Chloroflexota bacterium TaxID=166587 RepID=A0A6J4KAK2_9CHLR|nr:MAG: S-adenosylmethionine synthetase [uncultured Chloroflexota bacterium]